MGATEEQGKQREIQEYKKRVDYHRAIHRDLDDGALIAVCETYGEEAADGAE